ncbi:MAG TPA: hypothetical protein VHP38_00350, partial [Ruminiclostridium sp.]|nr:hypothetical protein [Ruminiclostridium sp.]
QVAEEYTKNGIYAYKNDIYRKEDLIIKNSISKLGLRACLAENMSGEVTINLSYRLNGKEFNKIIDTSQVPEIRNLFGFREKYQKGYKINSILVNDKVDKLYFYVKGRQDNILTQTWLYMFDLKTSQVNKLFFDIGDFDDIQLSPNGKYIAFAYQNNQKNTQEKERNMVSIVRCEDNKLILNGDRDYNGNPIGPDSDLYIYSYDFVKWQNDKSCILKQVSEVKDGSGKVKRQNVVFNAVENKLYLQ